MAGEWKDGVLEDLCVLQRGHDLPRSQMKPGEYPVAGSNGIIGYHSEFTTKAPGVTIGRSGNIGTAYFYQKDFWAHNTVLYVRDFKRSDPRFVFYLLTHLDLAQFNAGSAVPTLNRNHIHSLRITFPNIAEQRAIACILGALDDKIELNRRMNETLEAVAQAIFKNWFVDATRDGMPEGWRESTVDEEFSLTMGQSPPGETYNETGDGIPFFQGRTDFGFRFPTKRVFCTAPTRFAEAGDTLVSVRAPVGSVNMAAEKCCVGRGVAAVRHKTGSRSYTYYFMRSLAPEFARFEAEGTVFGSINKSDFHKIGFIAPPARVVEDFEKLLFPIDQRIENNEAESRALASLRDALLPKLISGELRVPDAEQICARGASALGGVARCA